MRIGIFGGSFDPIHLGHINLINRTSDILNFDKVIIVPNLNSKKNKHEKNFYHIKQMIELSFPNEKKYEVSNLESNCDEKHFSFNTLKKLVKSSNDKFFFTLGADHSKNFNTWFKPNEILKIVNLVFINRPGYELDLNNIISNNPGYNRFINYKGLKIIINKKTKNKIIALNLKKEIKISSSEIRKYIYNFDEKNIIKYISKSVYDYIINNNLYIQNEN